MTTTQRNNRHTSKDTPTTMTARLDSRNPDITGPANGNFDGLTELQVGLIVLQNIYDLSAGVDEVMNDSRGNRYIVANLTPELASYLLTLNTRNRLLRTVISHNYETDMKNDKWEYAADPVRVSNTGVLLDGQHRLVATSQQPSGWSTPCLIITGLPDRVQKVIDQGRRRSTGQQLSLDGFKNSAALASAIRTYLLWQKGLLFVDNHRRSEITTATVTEFANNNSDAEEIVSKYGGLNRSALMAPSPVLAFAIAAEGIDPELTASVLEPLADGKNLSEGSPVLALRNRNIANKMHNRKDTNTMQLAFLIRTWNYVLEGRSLAKMQLPRGGTFTRESFPVLEGAL